MNWLKWMWCESIGGHRHPDHDHHHRVAGIIWSGESRPPEYARCTRCGDWFIIIRKRER